MHKAQKSIVFALLLVLTLPPQRVDALSTPFDLDRLCREATSIVWGEVRSVTPHWDAGRATISSTVSLAVNQHLKGAGAASLVVQAPGGELDGLGLWVEDAPRFAAGEEIILFLDEVGQVLGGAQGKFTVAGGRVLEADMQPLSHFVGHVRSILDALGATPASVPAAEASSGRRVGWTSARLSETAVMAATTRIVAPDGSGTLQGLQILKEEGFEDSFPNTWTTFGTPTWGATSYRAHTGTYSGYCAGAGTNAVTPPGPYPDNLGTQMLWGPFSLADAVAAHVTFWHYTRTELDTDFLKVMVSLDGISFHGLIYSGDWTTAPGNVDGWMADTLDLSTVPTLGNLCGQSQVYLAILFTSDGAWGAEGAYVDDVVLQQDTGTTGAPQITAVDPSARAAGIGQTVTLTGRLFGASQGASTLQFWSNGNEWVAAPVVSWSDTRIVCRVPAAASSHTSQAIRVVTAAGSAYAGFTIKWSFLGYRWPGNPVLVQYYIGAGTGDCVGENAGVRQAANAWTTVDLAYHALKFWGKTSRTAGAVDGVNVVGWANVGSGGPLATTQIVYDPALKTLLEFDVVVNDAYLWSASADCPANRYDVRNVVAHEFGHALGLADLYGHPDSEKTMYGFAYPGEVIKRSLDANELLGIQWIY